MSLLLTTVMLLPAPAADWLAGCHPARWRSSDPASLGLLSGSPVNCLLVERPQWALIPELRRRGLRSLAVVSGPAQAAEALAAVPDALVVEGDPATGDLASIREAAARAAKPLIELPSRALMRHQAPVSGTSEGVWPGIRVKDETGAGPTSAPWIETNTGFLRYARVLAPSNVPLWISVRPPHGRVMAPSHFIHAIADATAAGARWIIDADTASATWDLIRQVLRFYQRNGSLMTLPFAGQFALIEDASSGAHISGGIPDMVAARHTPFLIFHTSAKAEAVLTANVVVDLASRAKDESLASFGRQVNRAIGTRNFGARVFNGSGMLSTLRSSADRRTIAVHLVNYTNYPVESVMVHVLGEYGTARLLTPQGDRALDTYPTGDGTGAAIDRIENVAILVFER